MQPFKQVPIPKELAQLGWDAVFLNDGYQVDVRYDKKEDGMKGWLWLSIKRKDKSWIRDWRELQKIKNMICGDEREGCELYPAESRLVDSSNQFHIFVLPEGEKFSFGYNGGRLIVDGRKNGGWGKGAKQREFKPADRPADIISPDEADEKIKKFLEVKE